MDLIMPILMFAYPEAPSRRCSFDVLLPFRNTCPLFSLRQLINPEVSHLLWHIFISAPPLLTHSLTHHTHTFTHAPKPLARNNLKGDIRNKFNTSANPRSALRTKRNLILDKPPDRISALALSCWFTAIPSTLTSHTLAQFPHISPPPHCLFLFPLFLPSFCSQLPLSPLFFL